MARFEYVIKVFEGLNPICEHRVPIGQIGGRKLERLVMLLAARYGMLEDEELIGALLNRNAPSYRRHLEINKHAFADRFGWRCGDNPHVVVTSERIE